MSAESLALAVLMGFAFGAISHWLWCWSPGKAAAVLVLVFSCTTLAQQLWRMFDGDPATGSIEELLNITTLRIVMATCAVIAAGLLHRRCY